MVAIHKPRETLRLGNFGSGSCPLNWTFDSRPFSVMDYAIICSDVLTDSPQISKQRFERILVLKLRHLGDVLLATPVFRALKETWPGAEIYACVNEGTQHILEGNSDLAGVFVNQGGKSKGFLNSLFSGVALWSQLRKKKFDLCVDLTTSDRSAILAFLSGAPKRLGFESKKGFFGRKFAYTRRVDLIPRHHMILNHLSVLEPLGVAARNPALHLNFTDEHLRKVRCLTGGKNYFQVHPISRISKKNWPSEFMVEAVRHIAKRGWVPVLTGSKDPEEMQAVSKLAEKIGEHINLCGQLSLPELGAFSSEAQCYFGVDTAPMHIAAAVGAPVIALFGPTSETLWAPWCSQNLVLSLDMPCRLPCKDKACAHINCLRTLTPTLALPKIDHFIDQLAK